jgi:hypothetical protein
VPAIISVLQASIGSAIDSQIGLSCVSVTFSLILAGVGWSLFRAAAIARRRIHLATEGDTAALWRAVGNGGTHLETNPTTSPSLLVVCSLYPGSDCLS